MIRPRISVLAALALSLGACPVDKLVVSNGDNANGGTGGGAATGATGGAVTSVTPPDGPASGGTTGAGAVAGTGGDSTTAPITTAGTASGGITVVPDAGSGGQAADVGGVVAGSGGATSPGGSGGAGGATATGGTAGSGFGPCDIYAAASPATPCVAAYSMVRVLSRAYSGPLYQVRNGSSNSNTGTGGTTRDIGATADGFADAASQDAFCSGSICTVSILYDQSGNNNHLRVAPKGLMAGGEYADKDDFESSATRGAMTVARHKVYSLYMNPREGYRLTAVGTGMPVGNSEQGIYMLMDGTRSGTTCCWDFGNASPDPMNPGLSNALFFGTAFWGKGAGTGPWFMSDLGSGVWAGGSGESFAVNSNNPSMNVPFAFGTLKTGPGQYAIRVADLQSASDLTTAYDGASPTPWANGGGIILGIASDNSNGSYGTFFEGAITAGRPSNDTDLAVFRNVQAVGYTK